MSIVIIGLINIPMKVLVRTTTLHRDKFYSFLCCRTSCAWGNDPISRRPYPTLLRVLYTCVELISAINENALIFPMVIQQFVVGHSRDGIEAITFSDVFFVGFVQIVSEFIADMLVTTLACDYPFRHSKRRINFDELFVTFFFETKFKMLTKILRLFK